MEKTSNFNHLSSRALHDVGGMAYIPVSSLNLQDFEPISIFTRGSESSCTTAGRVFNVAFNVRRGWSAARGPCSNGDRERGFSLSVRIKQRTSVPPQRSFSAVPYFESEANAVVQSHSLWLVSICRWTGVHTCKGSIIRNQQVPLHWTEQAIGIKGPGLFLKHTESANFHNVLGVGPILWKEYTPLHSDHLSIYGFVQRPPQWATEWCPSLTYHTTSPTAWSCAAKPGLAPAVAEAGLGSRWPPPSHAGSSRGRERRQ